MGGVSHFKSALKLMIVGSECVMFFLTQSVKAVEVVVAVGVVEVVEVAGAG